MGKIRGFEKVTTPMLEKFVGKHNKPDNGEYATMNFFMLPQRGSKHSAGYDFFNPMTEMISVPVGGQVTIWTNVKSYMCIDEVLLLDVRSSIGIKKGLMLANTIGVVDSDYYENTDNEGNIGLCFRNMGNKPVMIAPKEKLAQGIFTVYLPADEGNTDNVRIGGIGSTGK